MGGPIVVGYDGSDHGSDALELASLLARELDAEVVVACAYPDDPLGESATAAELSNGMREDAERRIEQARGLLGGVDCDADLRAVAGASPAHVLHDLAEQLGAAAIVVGATHHGTALRLLAGSTPERVLDHAPCPVAVAPEGYAGQRVSALRQVGVAYDGSPEAERALELGASLARRAGARLRVVTAVNAAAVGMYPPLDVTSYEQISQLAREDARTRLDATLARIEGVAAEGAVLDGDPAEALIEDAASDDLLIAGSRGHGPFHRVLTGSVSTRLLRKAPCPVLVVPRGAGG
jgi:nucleotide-binding universal stress UspA family protein